MEDGIVRSILGCCVCALSGMVVFAASDRVELPGHGEVRLDVQETRGWECSIRRTDDGNVPGVYDVTLVVKGTAEGRPPVAKVAHVMEHRDVQFRWAPGGGHPPMPWLPGMGGVASQACGQVPVEAWISHTDMNRLTLACSDPSYPLLLDAYEQEFGGSRLYTVATFFSRGGVPVKEYAAVLRFDFRDVPYWETVAEACDWIASFPGNTSPQVPDVAYEPLWNSWYGYHTGYSAEDMEREGRIAADLGIRTMMYDMGWDREGTTNTMDFAQCGDWIPDPKCFPNMKAHIDRMHAMGLRCILWCGFPLMGLKAQNLEKFTPWLLTHKPEAGWKKTCHVLDPRFPQVRKFATDTLVNGVRDWGVDGWKIDFVQFFQDRADDRVQQEGMHGRDFRWVADGARVLQDDFAAKVRDVRPDVMFEFMFPYGGILGQKACTQVRAADCPADPGWNRSQTARLRLLCGNRAAVHSDMLTWSPEEMPEDCALQMISVLHAVIQYGMRLTALTPGQRRVVAHWLSFSRAHRDALVQGSFRPHGPLHAYPLLEMESETERIFTVHQQGLCVSVAGDKPVWIVNGTGAQGVLVDCAGLCSVRLYDTFGTEVDAIRVEKGLSRLAVPRAGYVALRPLDAALEDVSVPVRKGCSEKGIPFWNGYATLFRYAPAFDFKAVSGATRYRFTLMGADATKSTSFTADSPEASLSPVWGSFANGQWTVVCEGLDAKGDVAGKAGERKFVKTASFGEVRFSPAARPYRKAARMIYEYMTSLPAMKTLVETGIPDQNYQHNAYPSKTHAAHIKAMLEWAAFDPKNREKAMRFARASGDYLLSQLEPSDAPLAFWPPTYGRAPLKYDPKANGGKNRPAMVGNDPEGAAKYRGQVMTLYPADVGVQFIALAKVTGQKKYLEAAKGIGETYLKIRRADGTWALKYWLDTGKVECPNPLVPTKPMVLFEGLADATGDAKWRKAADECFKWLEKGPLTDWNWDGQFEDIQPRPPYQDLTKHNAIDTMLHLLKRRGGSLEARKLAREILRWSEDQFVFWESPCAPGGNVPRPANGSPLYPSGWHYPSVYEQYSCYISIDASAAKMIFAYLAMYRAEKNPLDLAKAKALADAITQVQETSGRVPTFWAAKGDWISDVRYDWLNCMASSAAALLDVAAAGERE